jgi:hypothetical protein
MKIAAAPCQPIFFELYSKRIGRAAGRTLDGFRK